MKKQILNLGKALTKAEQKKVFGGYHELDVEVGFCDSNTESLMPCTATYECNMGEVCVDAGDPSAWGPGRSDNGPTPLIRVCRCPS